jgi:protein AroM
MNPKCIGALTIGQSPRPDLVAPLVQLLPECEIIQAGALDGITIDELPDTTNTAYPLVTRMQNGASVVVDESFVAPKLQQALNRLENKGVAATLLLCAGTFASLHGSHPIYKPFTIGCGLLNALNMDSIGVIVPVVEQETPAWQRWGSMDWERTVWTADLGNQDQAFYQQLTARINECGLDCIVLDYFGHPVEQVAQLQGAIDLPVIDLGYLATVTLACTVSLTLQV